MKQKITWALFPGHRGASALTSSASTLKTSRGNSYNTGVPDEVAAQMGAEDGQAAILDPNTVGQPNSYPHAPEGITEGHEAATGVIGHDLRTEVNLIDEELASEQETFNRTGVAAKTAIDKEKSAEQQHLVQVERMRAARLPIPSRWHHVQPLLLLLLLFSGDWGLVAVGLQVLGLSDQPWIPGLAFTDDLHLAALSSVAALVFLGDYTGYHVRRIEHALELRRQADVEQAAKYPKPAVFDYVWAGACFLGALAGVFCLSGIRAEYLAGMGISANYWVFLGLQAVILAAAIGIGFAYSNPEARNWKCTSTALSTASAEREETVTAHNDSAARYNARVDRRDAAKAKAGHHVDTNAANVRGQHASYKRAYLKGQLEPSQEALFGNHKVPAEHRDGGLLARLTGITAFPTFTKVSTKDVLDHLDAAREEVARLRDRIDLFEIKKLDLPELEESVAEQEAVPAAAEQPAKAEQEESAASPTPLRPRPVPTPTREEIDEEDSDAEEVLA